MHRELSIEEKIAGVGLTPEMSMRVPFFTIIHEAVTGIAPGVSDRPGPELQKKWVNEMF